MTERAAHARFEGKSTYDHDYQKWKHQAPKCTKQVEKPVSKTKFEGISTYQAEYDEKKVIAPKQKAIFKAYISSKDNRNFNTTQNLMSDEKKWVSKPSEPCKPEEKTFKSCKFEGMTEHQAEYIKRQVAQVPYKKKEIEKKPIRNAPFNGQSSYNADYQKWKLKPRPAKKVPDKLVRKKDDREWKTASGAHEGKCLPPCPVIIQMRSQGSLRSIGRDGHIYYVDGACPHCSQTHNPGVPCDSARTNRSHIDPKIKHRMRMSKSSPAMNNRHSGNNSGRVY
jgi:hypothetical protein